jgi:hypothetical protein
MTFIKTLWEIGAGDRDAWITIHNLGINIVSIEQLKRGTSILGKSGFLTFLSTLEVLLLPNKYLEAIGAFDINEHLEKRRILLVKINRLLSPGNPYLLGA